MPWNGSFQVPTQTFIHSFIHSFPALSHEDPAAKNVVVDPPSSPPKAASQSGRRLDDRRFGSADAWRHVPWPLAVVPSPGGNASAGITRKQKGMVMSHNFAPPIPWGKRPSNTSCCSCNWCCPLLLVCEMPWRNDYVFFAIPVWLQVYKISLGTPDPLGWICCVIYSLPGPHHSVFPGNAH